MGIFYSKCTSKARLDNKTVVITGANCGIGKCTAQDLYLRGASVIMACRTIEKAEKAKNEILSSCQGKTNIGTISIVHLDLANLASVRKCAKELLENEEHIDILINNAGIFFCPFERTQEGFEMQFVSNHLGHFLLTLLLLPKLIKSSPARIISVSSDIHRYIFGRFRIDDLNWEKRIYDYKYAYYESKLLNILFTKELAKRLRDARIDGVRTYALHPGVINTELSRHIDKTIFPGLGWIWRNVGGLFIKSPEQGAQTTIHCAVDEKAGGETGLYYVECEPVEPSCKARNMKDAKILWDMSIKMVELEKYNPFVV